MSDAGHTAHAQPQPGDALAGWPLVVEAHVAWGEMDAYAHVNNAVFFRWFESARIAYLDAIDFRGGPRYDGVGPILHSTHCRFRLPLTYPDRVSVGARTVQLGRDRFTMEYRLVSHGLGAVAAEGGGVVVSYHYGAARKADLPPAVCASIQALDGIEPG
jgi:acyl-CoA thioester hydrolase